MPLDVSCHGNQYKLGRDGLLGLSVYLRQLLLLSGEGRLRMYFTLYLLQNLPPQNVFAYLPLRSYGFRFIIQGDFEVPSSREDVDSDKSWNQWLREEIPQLFIDALSVFMVGRRVVVPISHFVSSFKPSKLRNQILRF